MLKNKTPIIHSYLTNGFFDWSKLFLKSLKKHNSEKYHVILDTRDISIDQMGELFSLYDNITFKAQSIDYDAIGKEFGISGEELRKVKTKVEARKTKVTVSKYQIWWKQFISVNERYSDAIHNILENYNESILHIDIDTYFRGNIDNIQNIVESNDVSLVFRLHVHKPERKIFGTMLGINGQRGKFFHDTWRQIIQKNPIQTRKHNFGQLSLYNTYKKLKSDLRFGNIDYKIISRKQNDKNALFWTGNAAHGKEKSLENCYKDMNNE